MKTFQSRSLLKPNYVSLLKGLTLFFLGASVAVLATYASIEINPSMDNIVQYIQKLVVTSDGTANGSAVVTMNSGSALSVNGNADINGYVSINGDITSVDSVQANQLKAYNLSIGFNAEANGNNSAAIGSNVNSVGDNSMVIGTYNEGLSNSVFEVGIGYSYSILGTTVEVLKNAMTILTGGNVGIGTSSPSEVLEVSGNIMLSAGADRTIKIEKSYVGYGRNLTIAAGEWSHESYTTYTGGSLYLMGGDGYNTGGYVYIKGGFGGIGNYSPVILQQSGGNVGIGTSSPKAKLDVNGGIRTFTSTNPDTTTCDGNNEGEIRYYANPGADYTELWICMRLSMTPAYDWHLIMTSCFTPDMQISLYPTGYKKISDIKIGDLVKSFDTENNLLTVSKVEKVLEHNVDSYLVVNDNLEVTSNHPMYINGQWIPVGTAKVGDYFLDEGGKNVLISSIKEVNKSTKVYNLHLDDGEHNYFVEGMLAHNK